MRWNWSIPAKPKTHIFARLVNAATLFSNWRIVLKRLKMLSPQFLALYKTSKPKPRCVGELVIIDPGNGISPIPHNGFTWTNGDLQITELLETVYRSEKHFSTKMNFKISSAQCRSFCPGTSVSTYKWFSPTSSEPTWRAWSALKHILNPSARRPARYLQYMCME